MDAFYVDVWYHTNGNEIIKLRSFSSTDALAPYLEKIVAGHFVKVVVFHKTTHIISKRQKVKHLVFKKYKLFFRVNLLLLFANE